MQRSQEYCSLSPEISILLDEALVFFKDLGVHCVGGDIRVSDMLAELGAQVGLDLLEVERLERNTWATVDTRQITDDVRAEWLGEAADWLAKVTLEELDDRRGEIECWGFLEYVLL